MNLILLFVGITSLWIGQLHAQEESDLDPELSESELLERMYFSDEDLTVVTSGRQETPLREVPEAMWVISAEQIRRSGATNIPQLLRLVPGMDVTQLSPSHWEVNVRDHEPTQPERLLVLLDSQPVYLNFWGVMQWTALPVAVEDIERIEVVLGPGSTLYGANAFRGIVNIITKKPGDDEINTRLAYGASLTENAGTRWDNIHASASWSKKWGALSTIISGTYQRFPTWEDGTYPGEETEFRPAQTGGGRLAVNWDISKDSHLVGRFAANAFSGDYWPFFRQTFNKQVILSNLEYYHNSLFLDNDGLELKVLYRRDDGDSFLFFDPALETYKIDYAESSLTLQTLYRFTLFDQLTSSIGIEGRWDRFTANFINEKGAGLNYFSGFLQTKWRLLEKLILTAGARLEGKWLLDKSKDMYWVPKASAVYLLTDHQVFRLSYGQAVRIPAVFELFGDIVFADGILPVAGGNIDLKSEELHSIEFGYEYHHDNLWDIKLNIFYSWANNIMYFQEANIGFGYVYTWYNTEGWMDNYGGEISLRVRPVNWLDIQLAYSLNLVEDDDSDSHPPSYPRDKISAWIFAKPISDLEITNHLYYLSTYQKHSGYSADDVKVVNPTLLWDLRFSYLIYSKLWLFAQCSNLLNEKIDNGYGLVGLNSQHQSPGAELIGRQIMVGIQATY
jgi:iron complex outermembrane receptor protein